ncbi:MAG: acyl-CoA thioesterase [Candidatus Micrarchaeia archaeon]
MEFLFKEKVRLYDTDAQGIVHFASYYRFFTDALDEFRSKLFPNFSLLEGKVSFVTVESHAEYIKPAKLGDVLSVKVKPSLLSDKAVKFEMEVYKGKVLLCKGYMTQVAIDTKVWKAVPIPEEMKKKLV